MESISVVRSLHAGANSLRKFPPEKPLSYSAPLSNLAFSLASAGSGRSILSTNSHARRVISCVKATKDASEQVVQSGKKIKNNAAFPEGFETLVLDVCDETDIAEIKLKVGGYEMHLRRNVGSTQSQPSPPLIVSPTMAPPIPSEPMTESIPAAPPAGSTSPKLSQASVTPFSSNSSMKTKKLVELEASGVKTYAVVSSPTVGFFRSGRMFKGKRMPPSFQEGDLIDEGQIIGYLDQLGSELPVKSDVEGEVLKILCKDGDAVGYGDPLIAVLPSFHSTIL